MIWKRLKRYEDSSHTVLLLEKYIEEQQAIIQQKDKQLQKAKEYFMDYLSGGMSANDFSEMWNFGD